MATPTSGSGSSGSGQGGTQSKGVANQPATSAPKTDSKATDAAKQRSDAAQKAQSTAKVDPIAQASALRASGVQPGSGTAAAIAAAGSPGGVETAGESPKTADEVEAPAAVITPSGQIPHGMIPSPSGPMPAANIADPVAAQKAQDAALLSAHAHAQRGLRGHRKLTREQLAGMGRAEIRAVATDRGYDLGEGGRRVSIANFLKAQDEDELIQSDEEVAADLRATQPQPGVAAFGTGAVGPAAASGGGAVGVAPGRAAEAEKAVQEAGQGEAKEPVTVEEDEEK